MKRSLVCGAAAVILLAATARADVITHGTTTINMDFVTVGDPGNDPDDEVMGGRLDRIRQCGLRIRKR